MADAISTTLSVVSGVVYVMVGFQVGKRDVSDEARPAMRAFQVWWFGLAALVGGAAIFQVLQVLGYHGLPLALGFVNLIVDLILGAFAGLVYYLLYLYTGRRAVGWPVAMFYLALLVIVQTLLILMRPVGFGVPVGGGQATFLDAEGERAIPTNNAYLSALGLAFVLPPLAAAIAYSLLYFRVHDPISRFRVGTVSLTLIAWFSTSLVGQLFHLTTNADGTTNLAWNLLSMSISLAASIIIYGTYRMPGWLRSRLERPAPG
jgi:hypothetical protein